MKKMTLIFACVAALSATPALAREPTPGSQAQMEHRIATAARHAATAQQFIADHGLEHAKDTRGWPCRDTGSDAVAIALEETARALAAPAHRDAVWASQRSPTCRDCARFDDCPDCGTCVDDRCLATSQTPRSGVKVDCVDCPDQVGQA